MPPGTKAVPHSHLEDEEVVVLHSFRVTSTGLVMAAALCLPPSVVAQGPAVPAAPAAASEAAAQDPQAALRAQIELLRQQLAALQQKVAALEAAGGPRPA